jgi:hypothetical protein
MKTAYPQIKGTCSIRLYSNIPFDNTYQHHSMISRLFSDDGDSIYTDPQDTKGLPKERFINRQRDITGLPYYYPRYDLTGDFNFDFTNGLVGSVVLELSPAQTNANYLRLTCGNDIYYYFITGIQQINFETYKLSLELDVLMTYQDEFLQGIRGKPVMTDRKHCHRYDNSGIYPKCYDFKTGESVFAGVKPSLIDKVIKLHYFNNDLKGIEDVKWLYICVDIHDLSGNIDEVAYNCNGKLYPLVMLAIPINVNKITYQKLDASYSKTYTRENIVSAIQKLIGDGSVHGAKISPYPPFYPSSPTIITFNGSREMTIASNVSQIPSTPPIEIYKMSIGNNELIYGTFTGLSSTLLTLVDLGCLIISKQQDTQYQYDDITELELGLTNTSKPTINSLRYKDPKLLFSPFKKYKLSAQYSSEGYEFFPELVYSENVDFPVDYYIFTNATAYIGDNNFYTKILVSSATFDNYKYEKIGLACAVNYIFPCGENALDVFNTTQAQSFYTSKVASGVTSGLSIAGGVGSIIGGVALTATGGGSVGGVGLIAGGATAIAGGVAGIANTVKSANAKVEDLKNTPDSVNVSGSNFISDECITENTNGLPYIIIYKPSKAVEEQANDFFYNYGYQVARDCQFNTDLYFEPDDNHIDNNLFGRRIFNYIKLNEDITNKIDYDMPLIAKQKLSKIFNDGITIWSFFGNYSLWYINDVTSSTDPDKWFMKHTYDNSEW